MSIRRILIVGALITLSLPFARAETKASKPVAFVYALKGKASVVARPPRPLRSLDRLPAGTTLEVEPSSRLALAFASGLRYELRERSQVTLGPEDLASHTGPVLPLPRLPPFRLAPIAKDDHPGPSAGAVRIRGDRITGLYPRHGAAVLAEGVVLRFQPVTGAERYRIEVQDDQGGIVFQTDVESPPVKVSAGTLRANHRYSWTVRTLDRPGPVAQGGADLVILGEDAARAREEARKVLEGEGPGSLPLLAEIDRGLGLLLETREDLQKALESEPSDPALREVLAGLEAQLGDKDDHD